MRSTKNCHACIQHWSTERAQTTMKTPDCRSHNQCFKAEWIGLRSFASSAIFTWPFANQLPLLQASQQLFPGKTLPQPAGCKKKKKKKMFSKVHWILKHGFLCYRNKQTFLICKNVLTLMIPILINKNVFEPNYNDLKLMVQNHNHKPNIFYSLYIARNSSICKFW